MKYIIPYFTSPDFEYLWRSAIVDIPFKQLFFMDSLDLKLKK